MADQNSDGPRGRAARTVPLWRMLPGLLRDPLGELVAQADAAEGEVIRLNVGTIRPYLVTEPAHVQHILRDNEANYTRGGHSMLWRPVRRFTG